MASNQQTEFAVDSQDTPDHVCRSRFETEEYF